MKMDDNLKKGFILVAFGIILYMLFDHFDVVLNVLKSILAISFPFILGLIIAFILNVPVTMIEKRLDKNKKINLKSKKIRRPLSVTLSILSVVLILVFVVLLVIPDVGKTLSSFINNVPTMITDVEHQIENASTNYRGINEWFSKIDINPDSLKTQITNWVTVAGKGILSSSFNFMVGFISTIANFVIGFIFAIYILMEKEKLGAQFKHLLSSFISKKKIDRFFEIGELAHKTFSKFISGQCLEACILGFLFFIGMTILGFPYALSISALVTVTALIPIFGAFIAMFIGALLIAMTGLTDAFWFIIFFLILQQIEGNLIYPRVVGSSVGLPAIWTMMAVTVGGSCFGIWGMLISVPLSSVLYALLKDFVKKRNQKLIS